MDQDEIGPRSGLDQTPVEGAAAVDGAECVVDHIAADTRDADARDDHADVEMVEANFSKEQIDALEDEVDVLSNEEVSERDLQNPVDMSLYSLIVRQLTDDGFVTIANDLASSTGLEIDPAIPEQKLASLVSSHDQAQEQVDQEIEEPTPNIDREEDSDSIMVHPADREDAMSLVVDSDTLLSKSRLFPTYSTRFVALHKNAVRAGCFSPNGNYAASASNDFSIKYLDVDKMHHFSQLKGSEDAASRPVIRTYYDHSAMISQVLFHPQRDFLVSSSFDCTIKFFDLQRATVKRSFKHIRENDSVNSIDFHASGDFMICGTDRPQVYMYDVNTFQRYCTSDQKSFHQGAVTFVRFADQARSYASCSADGSIKIWDGINSSCVRTIPHAHSGAAVSSLQFSTNGKYLLSGGRDSTSRLWDIGTGRLVFTYEGAIHNQAGRINIKSVFSFHDEFIMSGDEMSGSITVWDTRTGAQVNKMQTHTKSVTWIATSPTEPAMLTCSEDGTAKFWTAE